MSGLVIRLKPLSDPLFRAPGSVFEAGIHGPAAAAVSLSYPLPSTISGALAWLAYDSGLCSDSILPDSIARLKGFKDHYACLERLLGEGFYLRPGLVEKDGRLYAYTGTGVFPPLDSLLVGNESGKDGITILRRRYVGIALDRAKKVVVEGMLYHEAPAGYTALGAAIVVLASGKWGLGKHRVAMRFGGHGKATLLEVEEPGSGNRESIIEKLVLGRDATLWKAVLLTPALLSYDDDRGPNIGGVIVADSTLARQIAESLVRQSEREAQDCIEEMKVVSIPRGELQLEVLSPGWSVRARSAREPYLLVPPGTKLELKLKASDGCPKTVAMHGLGRHSRLGWGTVALRPGCFKMA